ncbi:MAG: hypothetical protein JW748_08000 [Anaerolineales bacterium]|nr:hypothetical protein [Anaerolineales bacterium]
MQDLQKIRYIAANFPELQGLKTVPIGLWVSSVFIGQQGDLSLGCILTPVFLCLYWIIHRYYRRTFGRVEVTKEYRRKYLLLSVAVMVLGFAGLALDLLYPTSISLFAVAMAIIMLWNYAWMVRQSGVRSPAVFPAGLVCIALVFFSAFLPMLGMDVAATLGFQSKIRLVGFVIGWIYVMYGVFEHFILIRSLSLALEADHSQPEHISQA